MSAIPSEYTLVIAEKPDVAKRIAAALGGSSVEVSSEYILCRGKTNYVIVPAAGHLFSLAPSCLRRDIDPVLDLNWVPLSAINKKRGDVDRRIEAFKSLSKRASKLIIACDYDTEGDTIGYNILKHACGLKSVGAFRAKFSALTEDELTKSFSDMTWQENWPMAEAGLTRHFLDYVWGINLSRALTGSLLEVGGKYITLSIGRVQGPTVNYVYEREVEIRTHVPVPYWQVKAILEADGRRFAADYSARRVPTEAEATRVKREVEGYEGNVVKVSRTEFKLPPPSPFNLGDLQHEAFRMFGFSPAQTLAIAEKLYLQAAISYPRTSSQQIPPSIGYRQIMASLSKQEAFKSVALSLLAGALSPRQGPKSDSAHPAIFPTGEPPQDFEAKAWRLYALIVRRFLSSFSVEAIREEYSLELECERHQFHASAISTKSPGWMTIYDFDSDKEALGLPTIDEGVRVKFVAVNVTGAFGSPPPRYNQNTLLQRMEDDNIGTKATRAEVIETLIKRGYASGSSLELSELGFAIVEAMSEYSPTILSVEMTRTVESELEGIEAAALDPDTVTTMGVERLLSCLRLLEKNRTDLGLAVYRASAQTAKTRASLGSCPMCNRGELMVIHSRRTGKRFVGCSNYTGGCRASAPLPQKGTIRATKYPCKKCGWPIILVFMAYGRRPWRLCVNPTCPAKLAFEQKATEGKPAH